MNCLPISDTNNKNRGDNFYGFFILKKATYMATVFKRVKHYLHIRNKTVDEKFDMRLLGKIVVHEYWKFKNETEPVHRLKFTTDTGDTYPVITYPRKFIPVIDAVINKYYNETYPKKERPRSPYNGKRPIYSAKPRFTNQNNL